MSAVPSSSKHTWTDNGYSDVLKESKVIWDNETIDQLYDIGLDRKFPGTKMPVQRLTNPQDRKDLVEFLKSATQN